MVSARAVKHSNMADDKNRSSAPLFKNLAPQRKTSCGAPKKRVLFVCLGNSCRSQMAEAFARAYGSDVLIPASAGLTPAGIVAPLTFQVLAEKNITADGQFPKGLDLLSRVSFDLAVNMSGYPAPLPAARVMEWSVRDPIGERVEVYRSVANEIEALVMKLILELRTARATTTGP
jgi:arsenate reductase